ncbi:MAG: hypothetical protein U9P88_01700 [Patescibacteria group bacterium]|nr:hypothetical protein [Patescibacteria group bacterium]
MGVGLISTFGWGISALISLIVAIVFTFAYLREKEKGLKYFAQYIWARFAFFIFIALALPIYLLTKSELISGIFISLWWTAIFISFIPLVFLYCNFRDKEIQKYLLSAVIAIVVIAVSYVWIEFSPAVYSTETEIISQPVPNLVSAYLYPFPKLMLLTLLMFLFWGTGAKTAGNVKTRSLLFGFGFLMIATTILMVSLIPPFWNGAYCCIGDILLLLGIMAKPKKVQEQEQ